MCMNSCTHRNVKSTTGCLPYPLFCFSMVTDSLLSAWLIRIMTVFLISFVIRCGHVSKFWSVCGTRSDESDCKVLPLKVKVNCPCSSLISTLIGWVAAWRQALLGHTVKNNLLCMEELQDLEHGYTGTSLLAPNCLLQIVSWENNEGPSQPSSSRFGL